MTVVHTPAAPVIEAGAWKQTLSVGPDAQTVHVTLPTALQGKLTGLRWFWGQTNGDDLGNGTAPDLADSFDVPVPDRADLEFSVQQSGVVYLYVSTDYDMTLPLGFPTTDWVNWTTRISLTSAVQSATIPFGLTGDFSTGYLYQDYATAEQPTVVAGSTVEVAAPAGFFTHGPGNVWSKPAKPAVTFNSTCPDDSCFGSQGTPAWSLSADGSTLSIKVPSVLPKGRDTTQDFLEIVQSATGATSDPLFAQVGIHITVSGGTSTIAPTVKPTLSGTAQVGKVLTAHHGTWYPVPSSYGYQWSRNGKAISGATKASYTLTAADRGASVRLTVTAKHAAYTTGSFTTAPSGAVLGLAAPKATKAPTITGTARVGHVLTAHHGTWKPVPTSFGYQWYRDGKAVKGATKATYKAVKADAKHRLTVRVTAKLAGHTNGTATTAATTVH